MPNIISFLVSVLIPFILWCYHDTTAFTPVQSQHSSTSQSRRQARRIAPHNVVFTRLSEDCIQALQTAQEQAALSQQTEIDNSYLLLALCENPGQTKTTLEHYQITWENIRRTLNYLADDSSRNTKTLKLADFQPKTGESVLLPYSKSLQETLFSAGQISQIMGAAEIEPHHVFLALLQYKEVNGEAQAATRGDDCDAMEMIWHIDATLEGEDICDWLLQDLMEQQTAERIQQEGDSEGKHSSSSSGSSSMSNATKKTITHGPNGNDENVGIQSLLERFGTDLTQQARDGDLDVVYGRDEEIQSCLRILLRRRKNNVCMIGEAGVGKTAVAEGIASILASEKDCPPLLRGHRVISIEIAAILSGTKFRGEFEERLRAIIEELVDEDSKPTILFLDEIHTLMGAGSTDGGGMDAANLLKPYLARGKLQVIGATTIVEYNKFIAKDAAMERRFQPVLIKEPSVEQTVGILQALVPFYQAHHRVEFSSESLQAAAKLSDRYINDRFLPDKAIDILDEAGALASLKRVPDEPPPVVTEKQITEIISEWSGVPVGTLQMDEMERLQALEESMTLRVKGQERAVRSVAKAIRRARTGVSNPRRPIASFLFCGPTGVGK